MAGDRTIGVNLVITERGLAILDSAGNKLGEFSGKSEGAAAKSVALGVAIERLAEGALVVVKQALEAAWQELQKWTEAGKEDLAASDKLQKALQAHGQFTKGLASEYDNLSNRMGDYASIGQSNVLDGMGKLIALGEVQSGQMERATKAALDLSAGLGIDLDAAFTIVAKAAEGNVTALGKAGIKMKATGDNAADFAKALGLIEGKFSGMGATAEGPLGAMQSLDHVIEEMRGELGQMVLGALEPFTDALGEAATQLRTFVGEHKPEITHALAEALSAVATVAGVAGQAAGLLVRGMGLLAEQFARNQEYALSWTAGLVKVAEALDLLAKAAGKDLGIEARLKGLNEWLEKSAKSGHEAAKALEAAGLAIAKGSKELEERVQAGLKHVGVADKEAEAERSLAGVIAQGNDNYEQWIASQGKLGAATDEVTQKHVRLADTATRAHGTVATAAQKAAKEMSDAYHDSLDSINKEIDELDKNRKGKNKKALDDIIEGQQKARDDVGRNPSQSMADAMTAAVGPIGLGTNQKVTLTDAQMGPILAKLQQMMRAGGGVGQMADTASGLISGNSIDVGGLQNIVSSAQGNARQFTRIAGADSTLGLARDQMGMAGAFSEILRLIQSAQNTPGLGPTRPIGPSPAGPSSGGQGGGDSATAAALSGFGQTVAALAGSVAELARRPQTVISGDLRKLGFGINDANDRNEVGR